MAQFQKQSLSTVVSSSASGQVSVKASVEISGSQDRDSRRSSTVKFVEPALSEVAAEKQMEDHMDETIKLFYAMPKGLEYFMNFGPPKQFRERFEVHKLDRQHKRMIEEIDQQMEQFRERWILFEKKKEMLLQDMANFEHFLQDNFRKATRAKVIFITNLVAKMKFQKELILLREDKNASIQEATHLRHKVAMFEPLELFCKAVCTRTRFPNFDHVMTRHEALKYNFNKTFLRYVNQQKSEELLLALKAATNARYRNTVTILKQELISKQKKLQRSVAETKWLTEQVQIAKEKSSVSLQDNYLMVRSVRNITRSLETYRNFTEKRLILPIESGDDVQIMDAIGSLILDYKVILKEVKSKMKKPKKHAKTTAIAVVTAKTWRSKSMSSKPVSRTSETEQADEERSDDE